MGSKSPAYDVLGGGSFFRRGEEANVTSWQNLWGKGNEPEFPQDPALQEMQLAQAALLRQQGGIIGQQQGLVNLLQPQLLKQLGFDITQEGGNITGITPGQQLLQRLQGGRDIESQLQARTLAALQGNAPVDPGVERNIGQQEQSLRNSLLANLGTGYETSSPGIEALMRFQQAATESRFGVQQNALNQGFGMGLQQQQQNLNILPGLYGAGINFQGMPLSSLAQAVGGYGQAINPMVQSQGQQAAFAQSIYGMNQQRASGNAMGVGSLLGSIFGKSSDRRLKRDIKRIGITDSGIPLYTFRYKNSDQIQVGVMADEAEKILPEAVTEVDGFKVVNYEMLN